VIEFVLIVVFQLYSNGITSMQIPGFTTQSDCTVAGIMIEGKFKAYNAVTQCVGIEK